MKRVVIESPYNGDFIKNVRYARGCLWDSLSRQESPFASHLLYTQVLNDKIPEQREMGMSRALAWYDTADLCAVYTDLGISSGMEQGILYAESIGLTVEKRSIKDASKTSFGPSFTFSGW
tara:strand:- start:1056 stop:1415 length:360 start_codon:yes stop_codon:yes gene_type:complete